MRIPSGTEEDVQGDQIVVGEYGQAGAGRLGVVLVGGSGSEAEVGAELGGGTDELGNVEAVNQQYEGLTGGI